MVDYDGRTSAHGYIKSSSCEPDSSGELTSVKLTVCVTNFDHHSLVS